MPNIFDIGIILVFIMFLIVGFKRGVIKEAVSLIAIILVFVLSFSLKGIIGNILCVMFPFVQFSGSLRGMVSLNILIYQLIAFMIVFIIFLSVYEVSLRISKFLQKIVNATIILWLPSKVLGGVVSFLKGYLIVFIVFFILMIPFGNVSLFKESKCIQFMLHSTPVLSSYANAFTSSVDEVIDLSTKGSSNKITVNDANLRAIDIMLKYDIVDKKTIESLIEVHKLDSVEDLDSVLSKY